MVNATIVVGLLILLTFSSVSSPFGQEEQSAFFTSWYAEKQDLKSVEQRLFDCKIFYFDVASQENIVLDESFTDNSIWEVKERPSLLMTAGREQVKKTKSSDIEYLELSYKIKQGWFKYYQNQTLSNCLSLPVERYELVKKIEVLDSWGLEFNYLRNDTSKIDSGMMKESKYHLDLASGPFLTNMVNLGMMFPFLFSAIFEVIVNSKKKKNKVDDQDDDQASKIGKTLMTMGFVSMIIGLCIIAYSFYEASFPYLK